MPPLGRRGRLAPFGPRPEGFSPSTLSILHHRRHRRGRAGQSHSRVGVDDRDDFAGPVRRLLEVDVIRVGGYASVHEGVCRGGREGDGRSDLLHRLNLVLQRRGVGRAAGERRAVGRSGVDRVQLQVPLTWLFPG